MEGVDTPLFVNKSNRKNDVRTVGFPKISEIKKEREIGIFLLMPYWLKPIPRHYFSKDRDDYS